MTAIYSFYIINKSGGVIFYKGYVALVHAISQQLSPIFGCSGIELLQMKPLEEYYMHQKKLLNFQVAVVLGDSWKGLLAAAAEHDFRFSLAI